MSEIEIRFGGYQPARSVHTRAAHRFGQEIVEQSGGEIQFTFVENVTEAGQSAADLLTMTECGDIDVCYFSSSYLVDRVPSLGLFDLPFQFSERTAAHSLLDGAVGRRLADDLAASTGFRVLAYWDNGFRHFSNWRHVIRRPEDCRGLKIRTLDNALHQKVFRSIGFEPVVVDVKDLAVAVAENRVDAQDNPLTNLVNFNLHKTHRFVSLTAHFFGVALVLCNRTRFDRWPQQVRAAVGEAIAAATAMQRRLAGEEDDRCLALLAAEGVDIALQEDIDRSAFIAATAGVVEEARGSLDDDLRRALGSGEA